MLLWLTGCAMFQSLVIPTSNPPGVSLGLYGDDPIAGSPTSVSAWDLDGDGRDELVTHDQNGVLLWSGPARGTFALDEAERFSHVPGDRAIVADFGEGPELVKWNSHLGMPFVLEFEDRAPYTSVEQAATGSFDREVRRLTDGAGPGRDALTWTTLESLIVATLDLESGAWTSREVAWRGSDVELADLDGDGSAELVVAGGQEVGVFTDDDWDAPAFVLDEIHADVQVADLDGDGALDLASAASLGPTDGAYDVKVWFGPLDGARGEDLVVTAPGPTNTGATLYALDGDGDGQDELLALPDFGTYPYEDNVLVGRRKEGAVFSVTAGRTAVRSTFEIAHGVLNRGRPGEIVDLDGDGAEELAVAFPAAFDGGAVLVYGAL